MKIIKNIFAVVAIILFIDFVGMMCWAMSGQRPVDGMYIGAISTNVIRFAIDEKKVPCSYPDPQFSGAEDADYHCAEFDFIQGGEIK